MLLCILYMTKGVFSYWFKMSFVFCWPLWTWTNVIILCLPSSGWNNVIWGGEEDSLPSGLQARVFPVGGCSATQSPVPSRSGVRILVLGWEGAVQNLQVCGLYLSFTCWVFEWQSERLQKRPADMIIVQQLSCVLSKTYAPVMFCWSFRVDISDTLMYVYEMLGAELLSNLYDKLGRLLTNVEQPASWQVGDKHTRNQKNNFLLESIL